MLRLSQIIVIAIAVMACGCAGPNPVLWHGPNTTPSSLAAARAANPHPVRPIAVEQIYVATSRKPQKDLALPYGSSRSNILHFVRVDVGIPKAHKKGMVESTGFKPNPEKHFAAVAMQPYDDAHAFKAAINAKLASKPKGQKEVFLFVHGFNNNFADSTFRAAQLAYDYNIPAVSVHYSWPSAGSIGLYIYDHDSATFARDGLADLIDLIEHTDADRITILAHSMGNYVLMEALRTLVLRGDTEATSKINGLLLAAPDIDIDVFQKQLRDIKKMPKLTVVLVSKKDTALLISGTLTGGHSRVGDGSSIDILQRNGILVMDMSAVDGGEHSVFASSPTLMTLVADGRLSYQVLEGDEEKPGEAILADSASIVKGAASLILYTPARIISTVADQD